MKVSSTKPVPTSLAVSIFFWTSASVVALEDDDDFVDEDDFEDEDFVELELFDDELFVDTVHRVGIAPFKQRVYAGEPQREAA